MKDLSQGNKGIQALAKKNPALVENKFGYDVPGYMSGGIAPMMPMYMAQGGYSSGVDFQTPFIDFSGFTQEELANYFGAMGNIAEQNSINREDAISRGYGSQQDDRIARGVGPSRLNYEDTPSNILPGADIRINA